MVLCYKTGSVGTRVPISGMKMSAEANATKGDEVVRCVCGGSAPRFAGMNLMAERSRFEGKAVRSVAAVKPLVSGMPKGYAPVCSSGDGEEAEFNFGSAVSDVLVLAVKIV